MLKNNSQRYGSVAITLHWLIALGIIGLLILGFSFGLIPKSTRPFYIQLHKSVGLTVLGLMFIRLAWRMTQTVPKLPSSTPIWQRIAAHSVQVCLYLMGFIMPLSGWIMSTAGGHTTQWFFLFTLNTPGIHKNKALGEFFFMVHHWGAWFILTFVLLHFAGTLKHYVIDRDDVLWRMLPRRFRRTR